MTELKEEIQEHPGPNYATCATSLSVPSGVATSTSATSTLLPNAQEMLVMMEALEQLLQ